jgi:hypothetical protein
VQIRIFIIYSIQRQLFKNHTQYMHIMYSRHGANRENLCKIDILKGAVPVGYSSFQERSDNF